MVREPLDGGTIRPIEGEILHREDALRFDQGARAVHRVRQRSEVVEGAREEHHVERRGAILEKIRLDGLDSTSAGGGDRRGGTIERVFMRDVTVGQVREAVVAIDLNYEEGDNGNFPPTVRDIEVRNVTSKKSNYGLLLRGFARAPISNVRLRDCTFENVARMDLLENVRDIALTNVSINGTVLNQTITR